MTDSAPVKVPTQLLGVSATALEVGDSLQGSFLERISGLEQPMARHATLACSKEGSALRSSQPLPLATCSGRG